MDPPEEEGCGGFTALAIPGLKLDLIHLDHAVCLFTGNAVVSAFYFPKAVFFALTSTYCNRVPPEHGRGDVSFWYATYCVVGLGVLGVSYFNASPYLLRRGLTSCIPGLWPLLLYLDSIAAQMGRLRSCGRVCGAR